MTWALVALLGCGPKAAPAPAVVPETTVHDEVHDVLYFVFVDRFADGTPDPEGTTDRTDPQAWHGGDLQGVIDHLDHLENLGIGGVWLSPITKARTDKIDAWGAFHGYWVEDLGAIEPRLGGLDQARELSEQLDQRGMSLWLDMVYNHVGYDTPLVTEHPDWFHHNGDVNDWNDPVQVVTHDVHGLPDLAQENEEVYAHLRDASLVWVDAMHPDGFRVDAVRHMPTGFLARLREDLRAHGDSELELLGEVFEGHAAALAARQRADQLDRVFDFPLHYAMKDVFCKDAHTGRIASTLSQDRAYPSPAGLVTFLDNHDVSRIRSACGGERERVVQALAFLLASRGTPCLTYGTEVGLEGAEEPANRADMDFEADPELQAVVRELIHLRARWPALRDGVTRIEQSAPDLLVVRRITADEQALIVVNRSEAEVPAPVEEGVTEQILVEGLATKPLGDAIPARATALIHIGMGGSTAPPAERTVTVELDLPLGEGEQLLLVGAGPALGDWNPDHGLAGEGAMFQVPAHVGEVLTFKGVIRKADGSHQWEDGPDRYLFVAPTAAE